MASTRIYCIKQERVDKARDTQKKEPINSDAVNNNNNNDSQYDTNESLI